ncbi:MAG TPA: TadE/TadG family type IV pilus assembly protein [Candidatus Limnocylindrales bacterium]|nr:TadE/TadG family type IV pilus assembly protein [Candidatus Limnocylindrales bacterium]
MNQSPVAQQEEAPTALARREKSRGQSLVEFALMFPILLALLMIAIDFGRAYMAWVTMNNMARIGANFAALNPSAWSDPDTGQKAAARNRYAALMAADATAINCTLPSPLLDPEFSGGGSFATSVRVEVTCEFELITPFLAQIINGSASDRTIAMSAETNFTVRTGYVNGRVVGGGGALDSPEPTLTAPPTPSPTPTPTPEPATPTPDPNISPDPNATPTPTPTAQPTLPPVNINFYGVPTNTQDVEGGGPANEEGNYPPIVGIPTLNVTFHNTTTGVMGQCHWDFGNGQTSTSCGNTVTTSYSTRGIYHVQLMVNGQGPLQRVGYVTVGCKVPSLTGVRRNTASGVWTQSGFSASNFTALSGNGNYAIRFQSLTGGMLNPPGGCANAQITVGP